MLYEEAGPVEFKLYRRDTITTSDRPADSMLTNHVRTRVSFASVSTSTFRHSCTLPTSIQLSFIFLMKKVLTRLIVGICEKNAFFFISDVAHYTRCIFHVLH